MDFDQLLRQIQTWTNSIPLLVLGSGASAAFGLPTMWALGEFLKANIVFTAAESIAQFDQFKHELDKTGDLERALQLVQLSDEVLQEIISKTWEMVNVADLAAFEAILAGKDFPLRTLLSHLLVTAGRKVSIVTTNYDRLAEYAASFSDALINNGFAQNLVGKFSSQLSQNDLSRLKGISGQVNLWKVHGSLDWFKAVDDSDVQMPMRNAIPPQHTPSIITPGLSKYFRTRFEPFRTISENADSEIEAASAFLCIGYGFNDLHVQPRLINQVRQHGKPIVCIAMQLTDATKQSIIGCKQYTLFEKAGDNDTRVYTPANEAGDVIKGFSYWELSEYLKLII